MLLSLVLAFTIPVRPPEGDFSGDKMFPCCLKGVAQFQPNFVHVTYDLDTNTVVVRNQQHPYKGDVKEVALKKRGNGRYEFRIHCFLYGEINIVSLYALKVSTSSK